MVLVSNYALANDSPTVMDLRLLGWHAYQFVLLLPRQQQVRWSVRYFEPQSYMESLHWNWNQSRVSKVHAFSALLARYYKICNKNFECHCYSHSCGTFLEGLWQYSKKLRVEDVLILDLVDMSGVIGGSVGSCHT